MMYHLLSQVFTKSEKKIWKGKLLYHDGLQTKETRPFKTTSKNYKKCTKMSTQEKHFLLKFIYSKKATKFCKIFTLLLSYVVPVKSKVKMSQNFVAFSEYLNFKIPIKMHSGNSSKIHFVDI